ncbi:MULTISPECIES: SigE family RNA polymerase sigma factor [unclassified Nocardioides]|uniref:SigE family RNA polymerase sigma factor n=1 Tax=unclassified Nocardioides TaxID=2615069 RepID=UPI0006FE424E|nr:MULTISPECIES: SigE family RNA polymerase sigma factor [unclassified Nocardioides]KQY56573.1 RNA polymerase subunit sigma-70 [Nocardioides sp. Root140]KQZ75329.1 RNA polymerase subunit sigma-70 [Nocardioides sp. Root151]KRF14407.1 RNA polymerase subunit sigma-70 [Nocardioides sp. Soil796]
MVQDRSSSKDAEFSSWMAARQPALLRTAYLLTGEHHGAEDLVQQTLAKVYLTWDKVRQRDAIDGYARRIMVNENNSLWRRAWKKRETVSDEVPEWIPAHDAYDEGQGSALWNLVQTLPRKQRAAVVLRYYEELTEAETADILGVSVGTVKSQTSRALATLRGQASSHGLTSEASLREEER